MNQNFSIYIANTSNTLVYVTSDVNFDEEFYIDEVNCLFKT